jgi:hypothetical protein
MAAGLIVAMARHVPPAVAAETPKAVTLSQALYHMLTASMKDGRVERPAMSNGIQFIDEDASLKWKTPASPEQAVGFYSGKSGIVASSDLVPVLWRANHFPTTLPSGLMSLTDAGTHACRQPGFRGFGQIRRIHRWVYQILAVLLLQLHR